MHSMRIVLGEARCFTKECAIFMLALLVVLILITYVPGLVTFLPQLIMGR
ncbi:MAG: hypothetical protein ACHQ7N_00045 [Candidatus Methylomirabilales bacterium]